MDNLVSRKDWGARSPKRRYQGTLNKPSTAHWNGPTITIAGSRNWAHDKCASIVRGIQNFHMDAKGWNDVAYNFLECPHGYTFEGRGLNVINGANGTNDGNRTSHAICSLAGEGNAHSEDEKSGFRNCVRYISQNTGAPDRCIGHRDHKSTACPGDVRYAWLKEGMPVQTTPLEDEVIAQFARDINDAYKAFLSRSPSVKELRGWLDEAIKRGNTDEIFKWIAHSEESNKKDTHLSEL